MEINTDSCKITVNSGEISVDYLNHTVFVNGINCRAQSVIPGLSNNWWTANWSGNNWNLDLDCGAQRFNGVTTTKQVKQALQTAGLNLQQIKSVISIAKKVKHSFVGRK